MDAVAVRAWQPERAVAWVVAVLFVVLALYWQTTHSMIKTWSDSGTYSHGFLIFPVFLWLVWDGRAALSRLTKHPSRPALLGLATLGLVWLIGDLVSANAPAQFAVVAMVPLTLAAVLGSSWVRALAFPLMFLFFAVPFGDALVPYLTDRTADFTVAALKLSGVPIYREGNNFSIPSGDWSVIEACSGIRYVFACLTVATLFAWTFYRSTARRLLFVCGALVVAIAANWLRAYLTVLAAHLSGNRLGTGFDHIVFAEVLYGVILLLVFWIGIRWREDRAEEVGADRPNCIAGDLPSEVTRGLVASLIAAALLSIWPFVSLATGTAAHLISGNTVDIGPRAGWVRIDEPVSKWRPQLSTPSQAQVQTFEKDGHRVSVHLGLFGRPTPDSKLTSSANRLVAPEDSLWKQVEHGSAHVDHGGEVVSVNASTIAGRNQRLAVWHWYWVDGTMTASPAKATVLQLLARMRGRSETSAWVAMFTSATDSTSEPRSLGLFLYQMRDSIDQALRVAAP